MCHQEEKSISTGVWRGLGLVAGEEQDWDKLGIFKPEGISQREVGWGLHSKDFKSNIESFKQLYRLLRCLTFDLFREKAGKRFLFPLE